uniref:rab GTPase-activating protein eat-17 n=1 Tax=Scatophagus argus TaxID=75038 RepID=UPI001ED7D38C|nr:rab GTPase-activating protein eat-17 [Scatophagus argus]
MKRNENLYKSLDSQSALQSWVDVIERDLDRQFPFHEMFLSKDGHGQRGLFRVLKAYTQYQPDEGYCQAQGPVAAVLLMNMPAEEAFWCLVQISEQYLPGYYSPLLEGVLFDAAMLTWVLKRTCPAAHKHLQHHGVEPLMFATDWLMCLFTRHLPFNTLLRVWDLFFCYGVRVLLQVAVVLVRRVLGRAEQRKQCQGQVETLERLRGVREEIQEEDDSFIAEVCSVPLSARDLEKQTEKELQKWRKDRPSSTFDPRDRCRGYRTVWERARQNEEEQDRKEREKGNLSIPLARSASTLSLSPSILHKRWKKGGKVNAGESDGGAGSGSRIVRHLSIGAQEDWRSWTELNLKKVAAFQEEKDIVSEEHNEESDPKITAQTEQKEPTQKDSIQSIPTEQEAVTVKEQIEQTEERITENEESQPKEIEQSHMVSELTEETNVEAEPTEGENILQSTEHATHHKQEEESDSDSLSQVLEQESPKSSEQEIEIKEITVKETAETEHVEENQTEVQKDADADTDTEVEMKENVQQMQADTVIEASETTDTSPSSDTNSEVTAPTDPIVKTETQQEQQEVITETEKGSQGDAYEGKHHSTESLAETDTEKESHTQTVTDADVLAQTQERVEENEATWDKSKDEIVQTESEQHIDSKTEAETLTLCSPECTQPEEGTDCTADTETEAEILVSDNIVSESSEAHCSEEVCDAGASEPTQEMEERFWTAHSQVDNDQTQAELILTETQMNEETTHSISPPSAQSEEVNLLAEPDGKMSSVEMNTTEVPEPEPEPEPEPGPGPGPEPEPGPGPEPEAEPGPEAEPEPESEPEPEQPNNQSITGAEEEEEEGTENVHENITGEDDVFIPTEPKDCNIDTKPQVQDKEPHLVKDQAELSNSSLASGHRSSSRSSGDFCIRRSSTSRGSRLGRRLSEDLFTMPQKTSQTQTIPNQPEVKHTEPLSNPVAVNPSQTPPDMTKSTEVQQEQEPSEPPKRFGLFRRMRGEQPKKTKAKGTPQMQIPKILIQDFSDKTETKKPVEEGEGEEKLSSRERRRRRRERERREKEEEKLRKKREKEQDKEPERRKPQTRGKSFQAPKEKRSSDEPPPAKTGSQTLRYSASYAEHYF